MFIGNVGEDTRSILDLISDLQARRPAFTAQPAIAGQGQPESEMDHRGHRRRRRLAAIVVLGILGFLSRGTAVRAHRRACGSGSGTRRSIPTLRFGSTRDVSFRWPTWWPRFPATSKTKSATRPNTSTCPGDLAGRVGAFERCSISDNGKRYNADVTVTAINGNRITTHEAINEEVLSPPSEPTVTHQPRPTETRVG